MNDKMGHPKFFRFIIKLMGLFGKKKSAEEWVLEGEKNREQEKYKEAIKCYDEAIRINPENRDAWYNKGLTLRKLGKHDECDGCYNEFIRLVAKSWETYSGADYVDLMLNKGIVLDDMGKHKEAINCCDSALAIDPNNRPIWICKGNALTKLHKWDEAEKCFDKAKTLE